MTTPPQELLQSMMEWVFSDSGIAARMEEFASSYCAYFEVVPDRADDDAAENRLVYTQIYQKFQELFEGELSTFLSRHGWTSEGFIAACQDELQKKSEGHENWSSIYEILVSLSDYNVFKIMMLDMRRRHPEVVAPQ